MSIEWEILGRPGADNALLVTVDSGHATDRLVFDCGERCIDTLKPGVLQSVDHLCISHFHMDHFAGFDHFFRHNYNRPDVPVRVWGPGESIRTMANRFRSFTWNLHEDQPGEWLVHEVGDSVVSSARFFTREAFETAHDRPDRPVENRRVHASTHFRLEAMPLPHGSTFSIAYRVVESDRENVNPVALRETGIAPGPWLQQLTDEALAGDTEIAVEGRTLRLGDLRDSLLERTAGESVAYLTDFRVEPGTADWSALVGWLSGTGTLVCECQYRSGDASLAERNGHMTADLVGRLAKEAKVGRLVLHHLSRRYERGEWNEMLAEARTGFPGAEFPAGWNHFE